MLRDLISDLRIWQKDARRKPLLVQGARQVGKTYLIESFGEQDFKHYVKLNFELTPRLHHLFEQDLDPSRIIRDLQILLGVPIIPGDTLLFFDEIQACPSALTSLKYFYEHTPQYHVIAAGSLLGVHLGKATPFPVGKVSFLNMYPLSFAEYLSAIGHTMLVDHIMNNKEIHQLPKVIHEEALRHLNDYLYIGGMPEVVAHYAEHKDMSKVREIQLEILQAYQNDFSKYSPPGQAIKTTEVWRSIPYQLAKENKKFKYSEVRKKGRAAMYDQTLQWLSSAGLIYKTYLIRTPKLPLAGYADYDKFKTYLLDTGLLGAMLALTPDILLDPGRLYAEYHGAFIESFVASELFQSGHQELFYWTSPGQAEVDFIVHTQDQIIPVEVKSGLSRDTKSLRSYAYKHNPSRICRLSPRNFEQHNDFINIPLYGAFALTELLPT